MFHYKSSSYPRTPITPHCRKPPNTDSKTSKNNSTGVLPNRFLLCKCGLNPLEDLQLAASAFPTNPNINAIRGSSAIEIYHDLSQFSTLPLSTVSTVYHYLYFSITFTTSLWIQTLSEKVRLTP